MTPEGVHEFIYVPAVGSRWAVYHAVLYPGKDPEPRPRSICGVVPKHGWDMKEALRSKGVRDINLCGNCWGVQRTDLAAWGLKVYDELPEGYTLVSENFLLPREAS